METEFRKAERARHLEKLVAWTRPLPELADKIEALTSDDEDVEEKDVILTRRTLAAHLEDVMAGKRAEGELDAWSKMVLGCDEVLFEDDSDAIKEILFALAHPVTRETLPAALAMKWVARLHAEEAEAKRES